MNYYVWCKVESGSTLYDLPTILPLLPALVLAYCGQGILHFPAVFEQSHVTYFGEWNMSRGNVCPTQRETLNVLCCVADPVGSFTCMRGACPRWPLLLRPGSEDERYVEQT